MAIITTILSCIASILTFFPKTKENITNYLVDEQGFHLAFAEVVALFFFILLVIFVLWIIYFMIKQIRKGNKNTAVVDTPESDIEKNTVTLTLNTIDTPEHERNEAYKSVKTNVRHNVLIMGIGLGHVSKDTARLGTLLDNGFDIQLLMINPDIIGNPDVIITKNTIPNSKIPLNPDIMINPDVVINPGFTDTTYKTSQPPSGAYLSDCEMDNYFKEANYKDKICRAREDIIAFIEERRAKRKNIRGNLLGEIELRVYNHLIPMNITIKDRGMEDSELIVEFCLPFSKDRIWSLLKKGAFKKTLEGQFKALWIKATTVDKDT